MTDADDPTMQHLLADGPRLRALARVLAGDADADDVLQQAWLQALELRSGGPLAGVGRPFAWLAAALRHTALNLRRGERRRHRREQQVARDDAAVPSSDELLLREERRRALVAAVDALPQEQRAVVWLRFFEGLPPRDIARRLGVPVTTVWSRLRNALQVLRTRLEREHGDRRAFLLPLAGGLGLRPVPVPLPDSGSTVTTWTGVTMMTGKKLGLVAAALVVAAAATWATATGLWSSDGLAPADGDSAVARAAAGDRPGAQAPAPIVVPAAVEPAERAVVERRTADAPARTTGSVLVRAHFADGEPAADVVLLLQRLGDDRLVATRRVRTDANGVARCGDLPVARYRLTDDRAGLGSGFAVAAGAEVEVDYRLAAGLSLRGVVVDPSGAPVVGALIEVAPLAQGDADAEVLATSDADGRFEVRAAPRAALIGARADGWASSRLAFVRGQEGNDAEVRLELVERGGAVDGAVVDHRGEPVAGAVVRIGTGSTSGLAARRDGAPPIPAMVRTDADGRFRAIGLPAGTLPVVARAAGLGPWRGECSVVASGASAIRVELGPAAGLRGVVRDATGEPVARAEVRHGDYSDIDFVQCVSATDGRYALAGLGSGECAITVEHDDAGRCERTLVLTSATVTDQDLVLRRGRELRGRVVDEAGRPVVAHLEVLTDRGAEVDGWFAIAHTDADGRFAVPNCPHRGTLVLEVSGRTIESARRYDIDPAAGGCELRVRSALPASARVTGRVESPDGQPVANASVDVRRVGSTEAHLETTGNDGGFALGPLRPGAWSLHARADGHPEVWTTVELVADGGLDLGVVRLPRGGRASFQGLPRDADRAPRIVDVDEHRTWVVEYAPDPVSPLLQPGDYLLLVTGAGRANHSVPFTIRADAVTAVAVPAVAGVACRFELALPAGAPQPESVQLRIERDGLLAARDWVRPAPGEHHAIVETSLAPGAYRAIATAGSLRGEAEVAIGAAAPAALRVVLR